MYNEFFENNFSAIRGVSTDERRIEIIRNMIVEFTTHTLSTIDSVDYVIPNYVRRILRNYTFEYVETPDPEYVYVKVYFPDFELKLEEKYPLKQKERELRQRILKHTKVNSIARLDDEIDDIKEVFMSTEPDEIVDVLILNRGFDGGDVYVRDARCPYLIHKFLCYDNDVYKAARETNRNINEFMAKFEHQYNDSLFL